MTERQISSTTSDQQKARRHQRDFHAGYQPVLMRKDVKEQLAVFRRDMGVANDSHIERCLVTAAVHMLLKTPDLHKAWIDHFIQATTQDAQLAFQGPRS